MDEADIALDAQWDGDPAQFCKALCDVGFLDRAEDGTYSIHDWQDHQPFAFYSDERVQRAKELAAIRWHKKQGGKELVTESMRDACGTHTLGNAPIPSPIPSPIPKHIHAQPCCASNRSFDRFWKAYPKKRAKQDAVKAWGKLTPDDQLVSVILTAIEKQKQSVDWQKERGQFIPYPAGWLRGKRWEDELLEVKPTW
jgi:hypothetical protein